MFNFRIRKAAPVEINILPQLELEAAELFRETKHAASIPAAPASLENFREAREAGLLLIAVLPQGITSGFALAEIIDLGIRLAGVDVLPRFGKNGIGAALVKSIISLAEEKKHKYLTLTTFKHVPWNAPFYKKLGFRVMNSEEFTPDILSIVQQEYKQCLLPEERCLMIYEI